MEKYTVKVCFGNANFASDVTYLDLGHQRVPLAKPIQLENGNWIKSRRNPIMFATAFCFDGLLFAQADFGWDNPNGWVNSGIPNGNTIYCSGKRAYDQMILKGLMVSARRAFLDKPPEGWPTIKGQFNFMTIDPNVMVSGWERGQDIPGDYVAECDWNNRNESLEDSVIIRYMRNVLQLLPINTLPVKTVDNICRFYENNTHALKMIQQG